MLRSNKLTLYNGLENICLRNGRVCNAFDSMVCDRAGNKCNNCLLHSEDPGWQLSAGYFVTTQGHQATQEAILNGEARQCSLSGLLNIARCTR
eukprot:253189-Amphidinium_carterae.1